ncbi:uncharacterized protein LOC127786946 [Diospyros lotus]|uniref:uncharacterized protein LOC127786946 n=1 Tax=Diospyros lotus TaxID=55363 RepID=UPI0022519557|nr:uncharacterized protein LOC127786946 [Diospyros lotus]XP_052170701.1 uncharacterized protein LOC127786946 [Diospyros lotus]XP_052170702.1 uncharacterized protein LOC127786946 [Diospyros lotus]
MAEESALERERLQIEQIRELDSEELQIEEVDDLDESSDGDAADDRGYDGALASADFTFDTGLASLHTYLGEVEETNHRMAFLEGGAVLNLPLYYLQGVLFPEATLPLRVIQPNLIAAVEKALTQVDPTYTIGVVRVYRDPGNNGNIRFASIGTTAEIRQFKRLEDGSLNVVTRGQQRFCLKRRWIDVEGAPCGEVQIIQEDLPLRTPRDAVGQLAPLRNLRPPPTDCSRTKRHRYGNEDDDSGATSDESFESELSLTERGLHRYATISCYASDSDDEKIVGESKLQLDKFPSKGSMRKILISKTQSQKVRRKRDRFYEVPRAFWPYWVYRMHDSYCLAQKAADKWKQIVGLPSMDGLVNKPDALSFYIASKIPLSESTRQELLEIDGISYRLQREIELLENFNHIQCRSCKTLIGKRSDMLVMSSEGPLGAYVNPGGYVHEIMTLYRTNGLALLGIPVKEYSWFPGYAWTAANCAGCESQMGWRFTAINRKLKPRAFWGIRCSQVADTTR